MRPHKNKLRALSMIDKWDSDTKTFTQVPWSAVGLDNEYAGEDFGIYSALDAINSEWRGIGEFGLGDGIPLFDVYERNHQYIVLPSGDGYDKTERNAEGFAADKTYGDLVTIPVYCATVSDLIQLVCELQVAFLTDNDSDEYGIIAYLQQRRNEVYDERWAGFAPVPGGLGEMRRVF